jgi:16S rRNA (adenine1518-N6/adenine1519-N6)-dimethyltransferase
MSGKQTLSFLRRVFEAHGISAKSKLGQNFLIDLNLLDYICRVAEIGSNDCVLEVGTGTGSLTQRMADLAGHVVTVEIDKGLQPVAMQMCSGRNNITFVHGDCLAKKSELSPEMLAAWDRAAGATLTRKLVANLPYAIATPLISNLLATDLCIARMVFMVQWEIAERMTALPGTKDYNALSVFVQAVADVSIARKVAPTNFFPRPQVDSAIVDLIPNPQKRLAVGNVLAFRSFVRDLYIHRRKNLRQALSGAPGGKRDKTRVDSVLDQLGIDGGLRAEALNVEEHIELAKAFAADEKK